MTTDGSLIVAFLSRSHSHPAPPRAGAAGLSSLAALTAAESRRLAAAGVQTTDDLWRRIGENPEDGIALLATAAGITRQRLLEILVALAEAEAANRHQKRSRRTIGSLQAHWLDAVLLGAAVVLVILALRASGELDGLRPPLGLPDAMVVAVRDLETGRVLRPEDLVTARVRPRADQFSRPDSVVGLILQQGLSRGDALSFEKVLRRQFVATKDIPAGAVIAQDAATVALSPFHPDATDNPAQIVNHKSLRSVRAGELLLPKFVD